MLGRCTEGVKSESEVDMTLEASLSASLSTVLNGKLNQLTPAEHPLCAALRPGEGPGYCV